MATNSLSLAQTMLEIGSYDRDLSHDAELFDELKAGYDVYFFTPIVGNLEGNIKSCTIRSTIPDSTLQASKKYWERKNHFDSLDTVKHASVIPPMKNAGCELYQSSFYFDVQKNMIGIQLGTVIAWDYDETIPATESGSFQLLYEKDQLIAQMYLSGNLKNRKSNKAYISGIYHKREPNSITEQVVFFNQLTIDTSYLSHLKIAETPEFSGYENDFSQQRWRVENEVTEGEKGEKQTTFEFINGRTEQRTLCAKRFYSDKGLLIKGLRFNKSPCQNPNDNDEIYYDYSKQGLPQIISSVTHTGLPEIHNVEWHNPDKYGNFQLMRVSSNSGELVREIVWSYTYYE